MDEIWQRHKTFILQCVIGGLVFLVALIVMSNSYSGTDIEQKANQSLKSDLQKRVSDRRAPSPKSIADQKQRAADAQAEIRRVAGEVASLATGEAYLRENLVWVLAAIDRPAADAERYLTIYKNVSAQTALTSIREDARAVLAGRAAQRGKTIDEAFGLQAGVDEGDVPGAVHALALVCDVYRRAIERDGIQAVGDVRVNPRNVLDRDLTWISAVEVKLSLTGDPGDVMGILRSFNQPERHTSRRTVLRDVESIVRRNPDEDAVKASFAVLGLQHRAVEE